MRARWVATGAVLLSAAGSGDVAVAAKDDLIHASPGVGFFYGAFGGSVSDDGRYVGFSTMVSGLSDQVYVRDVMTGTTLLASRADGPDSAPGDDGSCCARLSADGRYVAFESLADNLSDEDDDRYYNVYVRDLTLGRTILVSRATGVVGAGADYDSRSPAVSGDGRYVAFESSATNLSIEDSDMHSDVFVRDLEGATTTLASRADGPLGAAADGSSGSPSLSRDGRRVAFVSGAPNLSDVDGDGDIQTDVFLRDLDAGTTELVSRASGVDGASASEAAIAPAISGEGRHVAFQSKAPNLSDEDVDAYTYYGPWDVFIRDVEADTTTLVSRASGLSGEPGDDASIAPSVSYDGRFVAFASGAKNLSNEDADHVDYLPYDSTVFDVFLRDLATGATTFVSRASGPAGAAGDDHSGGPFVSATGRFVAFRSRAMNFGDGEQAEGENDVFLRDVLGELPLPVDEPPLPVDEPPLPVGEPAPAPVGGGRTASDGIRPLISRFGARPRVVAVRRRTRFVFALSEPASVRIVVRRRAGRPTRGMTLTRRDLPAGRAGIWFNGRIRGRAAAPGRYTATITAIDAAGNRSARGRARFRIVKG